MLSVREARASLGDKGLTPREGPGLGLIYGCLVAWALNSAIKSKRDRASVQDSRSQHCAQVRAFRRTCLTTRELHIDS